jgi:hypothetical protein
MAIVVQTLVPHASEADADRLDQLVNAAIMRSGGPPAGLMAHICHPSGAGFMICEVWRSDADMQSFYDEVVVPKLAEAGLVPEDSVVSPVWSFARP